MRRLAHAAQALRAHPRRLDAILALVLAALVVEEILGSDVTGPPALLVPAALGMTVPLAWRRTRPLASTAVVMTVFGVTSLLDDSGHEPQTTLLALLLSAYSVGAHAPRRQALAGLGLAWAAIIAMEPGDFIVLGPVFAGTWLAGRLVRARDHDAQRMRELSAALERERVEEGRIAAAEERGRIARELHDVVAHSMSTIVLEAGAERVSLGTPEGSTHATLRSIERTGREALAEMRRLVGVLRDDDDQAALAPQPSLRRLDELVERIRRAGLPVEVEVVGSPVDLPPGLDISAYRIVQEGLTNVLKHAGEARARLVVAYAPGTLEIEVADDGRGSPGHAHRDGGGHGLPGLRERVALFGGSLEAGPREGSGFRVHARLPVEQVAP
jgi:signal transduction histidine kinase